MQKTYSRTTSSLLALVTDTKVAKTDIGFVTLDNCGQNSIFFDSYSIEPN